MDAAKKIKQCLLERDMTHKELAQKLNISPQNLSNKLYRNNFSVQEFCFIMDLLGFDVQIKKR